MGYSDPIRQREATEKWRHDHADLCRERTKESHRKAREFRARMRVEFPLFNACEHGPTNHQMTGHTVYHVCPGCNIDIPLPITWLAVEKHVLVHTHEQDRLFYSRLDEWQGLTK